MCISDFSKVLMHEFQYNYIKNKYGNNSSLLFADSNSLSEEIKTKDINNNFSKDNEMFE